MLKNKIILIAVGIFCYTALLHAAERKSEEPKQSNNSVTAESAWKAVTDAMRPPPLPAEWAGKSPTPEQSAAFNKDLAVAANKAAEKAHEFYTRFPDDPRAKEAQEKEKHMLEQARIFEQKAQPPSEQDKLREKLNDASRRAMAKKGEGLPAVLKEYEKGVREIMKESPDEPVLWKQLADIAQMSDAENATRLYKEVVDAPKVPESLKKIAESALKRYKAIGQPFAVAFTAVDGREIDTKKMKGKVLLIDFWATWCGPCVQELPHVKETYDKYHKDGFEIIGISLDKNKSQLESFLLAHDMKWPQFFDGQGWGNKISMEYEIMSIPTMFLVDKKGNLRDIDAREDLNSKVQKLLEEN
ncbi:MAG: TlpA family protein disulfide reductase [Verrucomicrobiota bacterium]